MHDGDFPTTIDTINNLARKTLTAVPCSVARSESVRLRPARSVRLRPLRRPVRSKESRNLEPAGSTLNGLSRRFNPLRSKPDSGFYNKISYKVQQPKKEWILAGAVTRRSRLIKIFAPKN